MPPRAASLHVSDTILLLCVLHREMPKSNKQPVKRASSSRSTATRPPPAKKAKARAKALAKAPIEPEPVAEQDVDDEEEVEAEFEDPAFEPDSEDGGDDDDDSASFYSELSELEQFSDSDGVASPKSPLKEKKTVCIDVDIEGKPIPVSPKQLLHQVLHAVGQLSDGFQELKKSSPLFATSNSKMASVSVAPPNTFILSPSKNSFGNMRSPAVVAATKVVWAKVALHSPNVNLQEVVGAIAIAINLTAPYAAGSISSAFISQMKKALTQLLREVKSSLVGWALDTYIMVEHEVLPPRVPKCHTAVFEARKAIHAVEFKKLLAAPGGYDIDNYSYMHAFHAAVVDGGVRTSLSRSPHTLPLPVPDEQHASRVPFTGPHALPLSVVTAAGGLRQPQVARVHRAVPPPHPVGRPAPQPEQPLLPLRGPEGAAHVQGGGGGAQVRRAVRPHLHPVEVRGHAGLADGRRPVPHDLERAHPHPLGEPELHAGPAVRAGLHARVRPRPMRLNEAPQHHRVARGGRPAARRQTERGACCICTPPRGLVGADVGRGGGV